jgi:hypothetical protein
MPSSPSARGGLSSLRTSSGFDRSRIVAGIVVGAALLVYYAVVDRLPELPLWGDVVLAGVVLVPAVFLLVLLALPLRTWRGLAPVGAAFAMLAFACDAAGLDIVANFAKLAALTALSFWFLGFFERLSWVVLVAAVIPVVDTLSVWRGPTNEIVSERPEVFDLLSFAFPVPGGGSFQLGLPDLLFFGVFLAAAARWHLRVLPTWIAMTASFGITLALAVWVDPFDLGGLPALPGLCIAFLVVNADLVWRALRDRDQV